MVIALDKQKIHATIKIIQKIVGPRFVKPFVDFKKPFDVIPKIIAKNKKKYPDKLLTVQEYDYLVILSTNFLMGGPKRRAATIAIGKLTVQALKNLLRYPLSIPVLIKVIINVISKLIPSPIIKMNKRSKYFFENIMI